MMLVDRRLACLKKKNSLHPILTPILTWAHLQDSNDDELETIVTMATVWALL